ncbi:hypothetical protein LAZ40_05890 [Cereibacter sphaeroides]|uniref:hypothetical protein n=1 Tax=Cereibacter sphaeroides TaxID=1063 RepID=UPI001F35DC74|nr:hypothetical protein [Cereibacter sphaeroides]MCE6958579.1 hypothetical protein [Cereibacter sphaeroides]MCE6972378.1 hypothetical protein [Cereibacter sphaeroides]
MTPADGSLLPAAAAAAVPARAEAQLAIVLPGGRSLVAFLSPDEPPHEGTALWGGGHAGWRAEVWPADGGWAGIALVGAALCERATIRGPEGASMRLEPPRRIEIASEPLADFVRTAGLPAREVLDFLRKVLPAEPDATAAEARWARDFLGGFIASAATTDGFIEILAVPETDGLFAQGWSVSLPAGPCRMGKLDDDLGFCTAEVTTFPRADILPPGQGIALFSRDWRGQDLAALRALVYEHEGCLRRLDVVRDSVLHLRGEAGSVHVAHMLPRLAGPETARRAMRRICRPRYAGHDTLSATALPIAAALEAVFQAPDGGLLAMGWLLDPLARVERVLLKSSANLYAPLQDRWHSVARPDLNAGFATDARFGRLLDDRDTMHGFIAYAPAARSSVEGAEVYLELVLDDNSCLFRPASVTPLPTRDRLPGILSAISPHDPAIGPLVEGILAPFLAGLPAAAPRNRARRTATIPLGAPSPERDIAAIMPFRSLAQLQPVFALLAGSPEASALDLTLVTPRGGAAGLTEKLDEAFRFYGLSGRLLLVPEGDGLLAQVEAGIEATAGSRLLLWQPSVLPTAPNWLSRLVRESQWVRPAGLVSPKLVYEDGSICFGGGEEHGSGAQAICPQLGYPADWLAQGRPSRVAFGAAEIALIGRADLAAAEGLSGRLFGDRLTHRDLADRLHAAGAGTWCSGSVTFWALQDQPSAANDSFTALMSKVDAALIAARSKERHAP